MSGPQTESCKPCATLVKLKIPEGQKLERKARGCIRAQPQSYVPASALRLVPYRLLPSASAMRSSSAYFSAPISPHSLAL